MKKLKLFFACLLMAVLSIGQVWAVEDEVHKFNSSNETREVGLNNNASISPIEIAAPSYPIKKVSVNCKYNKANLPGVTISVTVGGEAFGSSYTFNQKETKTVDFEGDATSGAVVISFQNNSGSGTGKGTFYVYYVELTEGASGGTPTCAAPTFDPEGVTFYGASQSVELACATTGATIHYTLDGTDPTASSATYSEALTLTETTTIKAIAVKNGANNSAIASATYTKGESVSGYSVNFESDLEAYVDWEFTNLSLRTNTNASVTPHGGTYYAANVNGSGNGVATASITTKAKVATPGVLTFYISKESGNTTASSWVAQVSEDGSEWTDVETFDAKAMSKGAWSECSADLSAYTNVYVRISYGSSSAIRAIDDIELAMASANPKAATPTFPTGDENFLTSTSVTLACATTGAAIHYTTDGTDPTASSATYSEALTLTETTTIKAIAVADGYTNSPVATKTFTKATILTVAQALAAIDALADNGTIENQYVSGVISQIDGYNSTYHSITYWISADGTTTNQLEVYSGKGLNGADFSAVSDLNVGDDVTVSGTLKKYVKNSVTTPEFIQNNVIVARKPIARLAWAGTTEGAYAASLEGGNTFPTLTNSDGVSVSYSSSETSYASFSDASDYSTLTLNAVGSTVITATFAGNSSFKANSASYTLNVSSSVIKADISFECNGATSCPEDELAASNLPSPLPAITKAGYNFGGWFTDSEFNTPAVAGDAVASTDPITLYAKWLDPYTVTEALAIINAMEINEETDSKVYVSGIITPTERSYYSTYHSITYMISDDGTATDELKVYSGKGVDNANFSAVTDLQDADEVVVYGKLKKYQKNNTSAIEPEVNQPNYIYSLIRPAVPSISADPAAVENVAVEGVTDQTIALTYENIENYLVEVTLHDDAEGTEAFSDTWLTASVSDADNYATITYSVAANEGAARTAYMKVYAFGDDDKEATKIIAVSQEAYVAPAEPASLPFAFDGGKADIATKQGMSQDGLDNSDYASSPKLKFKVEGAWVIIEIASAPGKLTYDIKGNSFSGGTFKVQESADGSDYSDVATYTELGGTTQNEEKTLDQDTRFVKFIYTTKDAGNVALGNIAIAAPVAVETPTFSPAGGAYTGTQSVELSCTTEGATIYYTTNGDDPDDSSTEYTAAISVDATMTIKAIAYKGDDHSEIASASYTITAPLTDYYEKVTSGDVAEGTYLIVYEVGNVAFNGGLETLDASSNTIAVNITNENKIGVTETTAAATFYIDPTAGTIKAANGKYIGQGSDANGLTASDNALVNTLSIDEGGDAVIVSAGGAYLRYNANSGQERFRYFKSTSYTGQKAIQLYKLHGEVIKPASGLAWDPAEDIEITVGGAFSAPTLSNPNNIPAGDITIASSNTELATVTNGEVALVENATGTTTITATYTGETYKPITVSYKIKVNPANSIYVSSLNVNFGSVAKDAVVADKTITVTLTNVAAASAVLSGSGASAFSIDKAALTESGDITISASSATAGTFAATLTISDDDNNAESKTVNLSITVNEPSDEETPVSTTSKWVPATAIEDGMQVLITGVKSDVTYAMGAASSNSNNRTSVAGSLDEGVFTPGENTMPFTLVATGVANTYYIKTSNNQYLYNASTSGNSYLRTKAENEDASWTITLDGDGNAVITSVENTNRTLMRLNPNGQNNPLFNCYASNQNAIKLYVPKPVVTYVARIGETKYESLPAAVAAAEDGQTVELLMDVAAGPGVMITSAEHKQIIIDFGNHTYCATSPVGSAGTENQAFHFEKGCNITLQNGTITSSGDEIIMLIQNYGDLTLLNITLIGNNLPGTHRYVLSNNCGNVVIGAGTTITAKEGDVAFNVCVTNDYPEGTQVTVKDGATITGIVEYGVWGTIPADNKATLTIEGGNFDITWNVEPALAEDAKDNLNVEGGTFSAAVPADYCAPGYIPEDNGSGQYGVHYVGYYERGSLTPGNYATICLPNGGKISGASLFDIEYCENSTLYLLEVEGNTMVAGRPYIFLPSVEKIKVIYTDAENATAGTYNGLVGSLSLDAEVITPDAGNYILYNNQYWYVNSLAYVGANRAYIHMDGVPTEPSTPQVGQAPRRRVAMTVNGANAPQGVDNIESGNQPMKKMINGTLYIIRGEKQYDATGRLVK